MKFTHQIFTASAIFISTLSISHAISLEQAIQNALDTNPTVLARSANQHARRGLEKAAQSGFLPTLDVSTAYGTEESKNSGTQNFSSDDITLIREELSVTLSQSLFSGFSTVSAVKREQALANSASYEVHQTADAIALEVTESYLEVMRRMQLVELADENVNVHEDVAKKIQESAKGGSHRGIDAIQAKGRAALARSLLIQEQENLENARATYLKLVGSSPKDLILPSDLKASLFPTSLEAAIEQANQHPAIKANNKTLAASIEDVVVARSAYYPEFTFELSTTDNHNLDGTRGDNDDNIAILRMQYNLYRGGADKAAVFEKRQRQVEASENLQQTLRDIKEGINISWNALHKSKARLDYQKIHVETTTEVYKGYQQAFSIGQRSLLDVLDIRNELFNAKSTQVSGEFTVKFAYYRLLASMGRLVTELNVTLPDSAEPKLYKGVFTFDE
jgi:outer membrane protein, adhesin transport system